MNKFLSIYKEKKLDYYKLVIAPSGIAKTGLILIKDYAIISYLTPKQSEKIGELIFFGLDQCDNEVIEERCSLKYEKQFFSNITRLEEKYNLLSFNCIEGVYSLNMREKDGRGYSHFKDIDGNECVYTFKEKPTAKELGEKVVEMFEFKERYDRLYWENKGIWIF